MNNMNCNLPDPPEYIPPPQPTMAEGGGGGGGVGGGSVTPSASPGPSSTAAPAQSSRPIVTPSFKLFVDRMLKPPNIFCSAEVMGSIFDIKLLNYNAPYVTFTHFSSFNVYQVHGGTGHITRVKGSGNLHTDVKGKIRGFTYKYGMSLGEVKTYQVQF